MTTITPLASYILNKNAQIKTGYHKMHEKNCPRRPKEENTIALGNYQCPLMAKSKAKEYYNNVDSCKYCCKDNLLKCKNNCE